MNNFEKIKAMDIEEMAEFITSPVNEFHKFCGKISCPDEFPNEILCRKCAKQWLEAESEE